jgi:hypothetical protein
MKYRWAVATVLALAAIQAAPAQEQAEIVTMCLRTPGNTEPFCTCLAERAVAELPIPRRGLFYMELSHPSIINFRSAMSADDLPQHSETMWGAFQRKAVPACVAKTR